MECGVGPAKVPRILMEDDRDEEGAEEFTGGILRKADTEVVAKTLHAWAVAGVRIAADGVGGSADDREEIERALDVVESKSGFPKGSERDDAFGVLDEWTVCC